MIRFFNVNTSDEFRDSEFRDGISKDVKGNIQNSYIRFSFVLQTMTQDMITKKDLRRCGSNNKTAHKVSN